MLALAVVSVIVTLCAEEYVPVAGAMNGVAVGCSTVVLYVQAKICWIDVEPPVPPPNPA